MRAWRPWLVLELPTRLELHCRFCLSLFSLSSLVLTNISVENSLLPVCLVLSFSCSRLFSAPPTPSLLLSRTLSATSSMSLPARAPSPLANLAQNTRCVSPGDEHSRGEPSPGRSAWACRCWGWGGTGRIGWNQRGVNRRGQETLSIIGTNKRGGGGVQKSISC